jgi:hypothetical protein
MAAQSPFDDIIVLDDSSSVVDSDVEGDEATQTSDADAVTFSTQHDTQDGSADFHAPSSSSRRPSRSGQSCPLSFLPLRDWDPTSPPSESPPTLFRYAIEWRLTYNNRSKARNTEQEVVAPCDYWQAVLQEKVREAMRKKLPRTAPASPDDTTVVVSMRSKRNLVKTFDGLAIE